MKYFFPLVTAAFVAVSSAALFSNNNIIVWSADQSQRESKFWKGRKSTLITSHDQSVPAQLPGPADTWAGGDQKTIEISLPAARKTRLLLDLYDSHENTPTILSTTVNGREVERTKINKGHGKGSDHWKRFGKTSSYVIEIPLEAFSGNAEPVVNITSVSGSWIAIKSLTAYQKAMFWEVWHFIPKSVALKMFWISSLLLLFYCVWIIFRLSGLNPRQSAFGIISVLGAPMLLFVLVEGVLTVIDVSDPQKAEDPYVGFKNNINVFIENPDDPATLMYNPRRSQLKQYISKVKPENEYRIAFFGGSNVFKFQPELALFEQMLEKANPDLDVKSINFGLPAYGSHRVVPMVKEAVQYDLDLILIYSGHNEFLEKRFFENILTEPEILTSARLFFQKLRFYTLMRSAYRAVKAKAVGMHTDQARREHETGKIDLHGADVKVDWGKYTNRKFQRFTLFQYESNLNRIAKIAADSNVPILIGILASPDLTRPRASCFDFKRYPHKWGRVRELIHKTNNIVEEHNDTFLRLMGRDVDYTDAQDILKKIEPFFKEAESLLPEEADTLYLKGFLSYFNKDYEESKRALLKSAENDCTPYRSTPHINRIVRRVARDNSLFTADIEKLITDHSPFGVSYTDAETKSRDDWDGEPFDPNAKIRPDFDPDGKGSMFFDYVHLNYPAKIHALRLFADVIIENKLLDR